ncbi:MAG: hypothetical protein H0W67_08910 [Gemmatimonadales bacterium]|nr:hypothetical protein [Gemmatimonadales bacterium]
MKAALLVVLLAGCGRLACRQPERIPFATCRDFRPALATRLFDGRVGSFTIRNATRHWIAVNLFDPGDEGAVSIRGQAGPGAVLLPAGPDGIPHVLGAGWGVQVNGSCVRTIGEAAEWTDGAFTLTWRASPPSSFRPAHGTTAPRR